MMPPSPHPHDRKQALRLRRFLMASSTYMLGITILAMCTYLGLFHTRGLALLAAAFMGVNVMLFGVFRSGWNLRFADPSLTALQTYCATVAVRNTLFDGRLDMRVEGVHAVLVVGSSIWYGVAAGFISNLRGRLRESVRTIFGGEAFMALLPGVSLAQAQACAERLRRGVADLAAPAGTDARVTVSIGVAEFTPGEAAAALIERADRALYRAKGAGRNQVATDICTPVK